MAKPFKLIREKMSPESLERSNKRAKKMLEDIARREAESADIPPEKHQYESVSSELPSCADAPV